MYVQAAEEVLVDLGQIFLPFLDDYFIPFTVILHRSSAVAKFQALIVTSLTEKKQNSFGQELLTERAR